MPLAPVGGQPLSNPFMPVLRTGDANNVTLEVGQLTIAGATAPARVYTLPPLANVGPGAWVMVMTVVAGGSIAISPDGAELMNDGVGAQTITGSRDVGILFIAKVLDGGVAPSWWRVRP